MKKQLKDPRSNKYIRALIYLSTALIITAMFPKYESLEADYTVGNIWSKEDLIAPFTFPVYKSESLYEKEISDASSSVLPIYDVNTSKAASNWLDSLNILFTNIEKILKYQSEINRERSLPEEKRIASPQTLENLKNDLQIIFSEVEWNLLNRLYSQEISGLNYDAFKKRIILSMNEVNNKRIIDTLVASSQQKISYVRNRVEETIPVQNVLSLSDAKKYLNDTYNNSFRQAELTSSALKVSERFIYFDLTFNVTETQKVVNAAKETVPKTIGIVRENERIISKHEAITENARLKLDSYNRIRSEQQGSRDYYLQLLGRFIFILSILGLLGVFLYKIRPRIYNDNNLLIIIASILLIESIFTYISFNIEIKYPAEYLIIVPVAAIIMTIIFDSRLAFYSLFIICIIVAALRGGDYQILFPHFMASSLAIYSVRDIKNRSQIFISMIYIFIGYAVSITALNLDRNDTFATYSNQLLISGINSVLSPVFVYGLMLFYEKVFRIATDLVFLELSDFNHPLLRELASKAPGTFHHSMTMGTLSEQAAKEIGANQILARVGCYYHDIGKIIKPDYFVENQLDSNKHEELNPSLSAKVIISHVKYGVQLAEKYRLPREIINFIPMHHGTTLVSYFYEKARGDDMNSDEIHDFIYRYPGPKPQTKETGIVMLADSVEAASRAIEEPTAAKIETQIEEIIKARFLEGELDECALTLNELMRIKKSFLRTLVGIHHHRIKYPDGDDERVVN